MKIRTGFVSNSSSSSFAILGIKRKLNEIDPSSFKRKVMYFVRPDSNFDGGEGPQYFYIGSNDVLEFFKEHKENVRAVYEIVLEIDEGESVVDMKKISSDDKLVLVAGTMDQHCPDDLAEIKEMFSYAGLLEEPEEEFDVTDTDTLRLEFTSGNSNKFYLMKKNRVGGTFDVTYGKIGTAGQTLSYPLSEWDAKILEKTKKGYVIV